MGFTLFLGCALLAPQIVSDARLAPPRTLESHHPADLDVWATRGPEVRRRVLVAAGLWPTPARVELSPAIIHGAIEREGYVVEKVYFESLPGFHVTGNLYRPDGPGPFPGVLCPHGHWTDGRFSAIPDDDVGEQLERGEEERSANARYHLQARCATLAKMGCVVFHYDMVGYADSRQLVHDAGFGDVEAELWGMSWFGLQTRNSVSALDFLLARPEVDPERIAVTGASGGGTQTFVLGAVDDRPDLLLPAVMVSTGMQGGCVCENASHLRVGAGNVDFAALAAPRTLGLTGADDWTIRLMDDVYPPLRELYDRIADSGGSRGVLEAWCYPDHPHNYNLVARGHLYELVASEFDLATLAREPDLVPIDPERLSVYDGEHSRPNAGIGEVRGELLGLARGEVARLAQLATDDLPEFRRVVGGALETMVAPRAGPDEAWWHGMLELVERRAGSATVRGTGAADAPLRLVGPEPREASGSLVGPVLVTTMGGDSRRVELETRWRERGAPVLTHRPLLCPLGDGESASLPVDEERHGTFVGYTFGYNRTLFAERVGDLLLTLRLASRGGRSVALWGAGDAALCTLGAAALAGERVDRVALALDRDFAEIETLDDPDLLPGALRWGGVPHFAALIAPTPLLLLGLDEVPVVVRDAYAAAGAPDEVRAQRELALDELEVWLAGE
jgi:dienelactone hydrolase